MQLWRIFNSRNWLFSFLELLPFAAATCGGGEPLAWHSILLGEKSVVYRGGVAESHSGEMKLRDCIIRLVMAATSREDPRQIKSKKNLWEYDSFVYVEYISFSLFLLHLTFG